MGSTRQRPDWGFRSIMGLVLAGALWLLALPICSLVQQAALQRYHLQTRCFALWALQAPLPAMYNFYNRYRVEPQPWDATFFSQPVTGTINHFPVRLYTFGETRGELLGDVDRRMLTVRSDYRGQSLTTRWTASESARGGFELSDEVVP